MGSSHIDPLVLGIEYWAWPRGFYGLKAQKVDRTSNELRMAIEFDFSGYFTQQSYEWFFILEQVWQHESDRNVWECWIVWKCIENDGEGLLFIESKREFPWIN